MMRGWRTRNAAFRRRHPERLQGVSDSPAVWITKNAKGRLRRAPLLPATPFRVFRVAFAPCVLQSTLRRPRSSALVRVPNGRRSSTNAGATNNRMLLRLVGIIRLFVRPFVDGRRINRLTLML